jgi:hypothetical protein
MNNTLFLLQIVADSIPFSNPTLTAAVYEKVLNEFLNARNYSVRRLISIIVFFFSYNNLYFHQQFKYLIKKWPCDIYDLKCITNAALEFKKEDDNRLLLESIAVL